MLIGFLISLVLPGKLWFWTVDYSAL